MRISFDMDGVLADMDAALAKMAEQEFGVSAKGAGTRTAQETPVEAETPPSSAGLATDVPADPGARPSPGELPRDMPSAAVLQLLSSREQARLWQRVAATRNFWESLDECEPGTVRRIQGLAHELRWDVLFVTQRPGSAGRSTQLQSQHWLRRHGFEYPAVYTTQGSRGCIAAALTLDTHIDDRLDNCVDVATDSGAWPILVWRDDASFTRISAGAKKLGIATVRTVNEALDRIEKADRNPARADRTPAQADHPSIVERLKRAFSGR
ncbi:MAG: hypothetical protein NTY02_04335 [Acidobacteria bacterium]|nr:hypothetical protein [Acidobacteriota bacterium]